MLGSIQSDDKCPVCSSRFQHIEPRGLFCPLHKKQQAARFKVRFRKITRRFNSYPTAYQFLTGLRFEEGNNTFDERDYQIKTKPLSFTILSNEWLEIKKVALKVKSWTSMNAGMRYAQETWGDTNIKNIKFGHIEDFLNNRQCASKTKANLLAFLKQFWKWATNRYDIEPIKEWPNIGAVEMGFRNTIDIDTQEAIINQIEATEPFKAWLAIKWLATYIAIRPGEMISLTERQVDRKRGLLIIPHPKEKRPKIIPLTNDDKEIINKLPIAFNQNEFFFIHEEGRAGAKPYTQFGDQYLYNVWKRACKVLNVNDVDLYGGTKHSTAMGVRNILTFEEVRLMTGHTTNKAFERYFRTEGQDLANFYEKREMLVSKSTKKIAKNS